MSRIRIRQGVYLFLLLILVAFFLRVSHGEGLSFADDFAYINAALDANELGWSTYLCSMSSRYESRTFIVLPLAFFIKLFGASEQTFASLSLLFSLGTVLCAFLLGTILYNSRAGLIAGLIVTFIPQDIWYSTSMLPDTFIPLYTGLALLLLAIALKYKQKGSGQLLLLVSSGFFLFCAFETRVSSAIMVLAVIIVAIWSRQSDLKAILIPTLSFCVVVTLFWSIPLLVCGDFLLKYKILFNILHSPGDITKPFEQLFSMTPLVKLVLDVPRLFSHVNLLTFTNVREYLLNPNFGLLFYLAWPAFFYSLYRVRKFEGYKLPLVSFILVYLFFEFASTSLISYKPIGKLDKLLSILSIPSALLIAFSVEEAFKMKPASRYRVYLKRASIVLLISYVLVSSAMLIVADIWRGSHVQTYKRTFKRLKTLNLSQRIYVMHRRWTLRGKVMMRLFPPSDYEFLFLKGVPVDSIHNSIVIFDPSFFTDAGDYIEGEPMMSWEDFDSAFKGIPARLPEEWELVFTEPRHMGRGRKPATVYVLYAP